MNSPIDPPTHPYTCTKVGVSPQTINLQVELNYLNQVKIYLIFSDLTSPNLLTQTITHQSIQPPTHPPLDDGDSTNHKSSNRIELSRLDNDLLNYC